VVDGCSEIEKNVWTEFCDVDEDCDLVVVGDCGGAWRLPPKPQHPSCPIWPPMVDPAKFVQVDTADSHVVVVDIRSERLVVRKMIG
jgi:hypothetical protein